MHGRITEMRARRRAERQTMGQNPWTDRFNTPQQQSHGLDAEILALPVAENTETLQDEDGVPTFMVEYSQVFEDESHDPIA